MKNIPIGEVLKEYGYINEDQLQTALAEQKKEFEDLQSVVSEDSNARIKVYGTAYAGTKLVFGDQFMFIKEKYDHCQFIKERADIKSALL